MDREWRSEATGRGSDTLLRTNEITVLKVETVQFVTGLLRIHDIFVDDEGGALGVVGNALADLAADGISTAVADNIRTRAWTYRIGPNFPKRSKSSSGVTV